MAAQKPLKRRRPTFPGSLTDLHRFRKTAHGHDGSSRIVMVRKTDQRTIASFEDGQEPKLETITRETIETFRGEKTECKITTEKRDKEDNPDILGALSDRVKRQARRPPARMDKRRFEIECLNAHNEYRKQHGVPPLKLNSRISRLSQEWADTLIKRNQFQHSNNREYGENLFYMSSSDPNFSITGRKPVDNWYDEIKLYHFGTEPRDLSAGHFTQVIWQGSKELGVAFAKSGGKIIVVANYYPPGNVIGHFAQNVPAKTKYRSINNNVEDISALSTNLSSISLTKSAVHTRSTRSITEGNFEEDFLDAHNDYRRKHGVPALKLDKKLCKYSEEWAKHLAQRNTLEHRPGSNYGENIYCLYTSDPDYQLNGHTPVDTWYEEIVHHPFGKEPSNLKSGHFSQVIWKSSEYLGVGVAKNSQGTIFVVANYSPAGNFVGNYTENVPPLKPAYYGEMAKKKEALKSSLKSKVVEEPESTRINVEQFTMDVWKIHNEYRKKHGVPELTLSEKLSKFAQEWADTCAKTSSLTHRANSPYGENIFSAYSSDYSHVPTARDAVKEWYDESKKYQYGMEKVNQGALHFTQIVWKSTKELGVGVAKNSKGQTFIVCNYEPRGNYIGQFVENVPRPRI